MKTLSAILILLLTHFVNSNTPTTLPVTIKGHINQSKSSWEVKHLRVFVKGDNKILASTFANEHGNFELTFTPKNEKSFDFYCETYNSITLLISSVKKFESDTPDMFFTIPMELKLNEKGDVVCPKCHKVDKVFKIILSHPPGYYELVKKGVIDTTIHQRGIYDCLRDKISF